MVSFGLEGLPKIVRIIFGFYDISTSNKVSANLSSIKHDQPPSECLKSNYVQ